MIILFGSSPLSTTQQCICVKSEIYINRVKHVKEDVSHNILPPLPFLSGVETAFIVNAETDGRGGLFYDVALRVISKCSTYINIKFLNHS